MFALETPLLRRLLFPLLVRTRLRQQPEEYPDFSLRELFAVEHLMKRTKQWKALKREAEKHGALDFGDPYDALKFLHIDFWLRANILRAVRLKLHRHTPLRILDVGCGSAMFAFVCRFWGHDAIGLDQPLEVCCPAEQIVYGTMPDVLGVPVQRKAIRPFVPLELARSYDLICAFMICFNQHQRQHEWTSAEWRFFLEDVCRHLNPSGRVHLALNEHPAKYGRHKYYDESMLTLFRSWGQVEDGGHVTIFRDRVTAPHDDGSLAGAGLRLPA